MKSNDSTLLLVFIGLLLVGCERRTNLTDKPGGSLRDANDTVSDSGACSGNSRCVFDRIAVTGDVNAIKELLHQNVDEIPCYYCKNDPIHSVITHFRDVEYDTYFDWRKMLEVLLAAGADINALDDEGHSPLQRTIGLDMFSSWIDEKPDETIALVKYLLDHGADVNMPDRSGWTPLFYVACWVETNAEIFGWFMAKGAAINVRDIKGRTALHNAVAYARPQVVELYLDHGAEINAKDNEGLTPLWGVLADRDIQMLKLVIGQGANVNAVSGDGRTPLCVAVESGEFAVVKYLHEAGGDIHFRNENGETLLHRAISTNMSLFELVEYLVTHGIDINARTLEGESVLDYARRYQWPAAIEYLQQRSLY